MAEFICRLGTPAGEVVTRTVEAAGAAEARVRLEAEGFRVFSVAAPRVAGLAGVTRGGKGGTAPRVKPGDFLIFNQQLSAIIRAGIPILQAIAMLRRRAASSRLRAVLADVEDKIRSGMALSAAFAAQGPIFPRIYTASILAGERSGALDEVLARYVAYMRRGVEIRRKIRGALAYPLFLLAASFGMVMFLTVYVVPKMSTLFEGFNRELRARSAATLHLIREGRSFTESVESAGWVPPLALDMIGVGERSGSLREMLEEVADFHNRESEVRLEQLTTVLEPAILLVMGGVVVTILLSIYLPIIQSISNLSFRG